MLARIYRPAKNAMQSGPALGKDWVLEFEPASARKPDPLMGWSSSSDMNGQVRLSFETKEEAVAYAGALGRGVVECCKASRRPRVPPCLPMEGPCCCCCCYHVALCAAAFSRCQLCTAVTFAPLLLLPPLLSLPPLQRSTAGSTRCWRTRWPARRGPSATSATVTSEARGGG